MSSRHLSIRIEQESFDRLEAESRERHESLSTLAKRLIEEGLRMEKHPGVVFRDGPAGRRAGLTAGPDVWEIVRALQRSGGFADQQVAELAEEICLKPAEVRKAVQYYVAFPNEIDERIELDDMEGKRAYEAWLAEQKLAHA